MTSEEFALEMVKAQNKRVTKSKGDAGMSPAEVEEWLKVFGKQGK